LISLCYFDIFLINSTILSKNRQKSSDIQKFFLTLQLTLRNSAAHLSLKQKDYAKEVFPLAVDILSSLLTLDKTSKFVMCLLNRSLNCHPRLRRKCIHGVYWHK